MTTDDAEDARWAAFARGGGPAEVLGGYKYVQLRGAEPHEVQASLDEWSARGWLLASVNTTTVDGVLTHCFVWQQPPPRGGSMVGVVVTD